MADTDPNKPGDSSAVDGEKPEEKQVNITQDRLDSLIKKAQGRVASEIKAENANMKAELEKMKADLQAAQEAAAEAKNAPKDPQTEVEEYKKKLDEIRSARAIQVEEEKRMKQTLLQKDKEIEQGRAQVLEERKNNLIAQAAGKFDFNSLQAVHTLTANQIVWDEEGKRLKIVKEDGTIRVNPKTLDEMTLEEFYEDWGEQNPWMVKSPARGGQGGTPSQTTMIGTGRYKVEEIFGPKSNSRLANQLIKANKKEYYRLRAEAVTLGLVGERKIKEG